MHGSRVVGDGKKRLFSEQIELHNAESFGCINTDVPGKVMIYLAIIGSTDPYGVDTHRMKTGSQFQKIILGPAF